MAAIAPKTPWFITAILLLSGSPSPADQSADLRAQLSVVATSLTSGNAADAMVPFDKSYVNYDKLSRDFQGLVVYEVQNEVDVTDEQDTADGANLIVAWTLTITDKTTNRIDRRAADINVRLLLKKGKWKIVDFSPIDIFNPLVKKAGAGPNRYVFE